MSALVDRYARVRAFSLDLTASLETEDYVIQTMPDVSPAKWHLAHTTWFFETFVLAEQPGHRPFDPAFGVLFNSYYNAVGEQFSRAHRGLLSRPTVARVKAYRAHVDRQMAELLGAGVSDDLAAVIEIGLHHEQQHQELILTDIKHVLGFNPLHPALRDPEQRPARSHERAAHQRWHPFEGGVVEVGHVGDGFCFDNERPRHRVLLDDFDLAHRPVTNGEYLAFMEDGGYRESRLWLSDGWSAVNEDGWRSPMYWVAVDGAWHHFTLHGLAPIDPAAPVTHVSLYEADAFASWAGARLPTEFEWEHACTSTGAQPDDAGTNFADDGHLQPICGPSNGSDAPIQLLGDVWEWTRSAYSPYPGFAPLPGALGEYNGKFMCGQMVLRGGSCATSRDHVRPSYRNFFPASARWQFSGIRLAR